jgi:Subtilase family
MALRGNGQLLIEIPGSLELLGSTHAEYPGYDLEPLSAESFSRERAEKQWLLALPKSRLTETDPSPWDSAHSAARGNNYTHYIEPDIYHDRSAPVATSEQGLDGNWPPFVSDETGVSPGWHLESQFTGFTDVRTIATGRGIRIAHLDTGYTPGHFSEPRNLKTEWAYDFWDHKPGAVDPGDNSAALDNPGHGTATLALLAGRNVSVQFGTHSFQGDIGGAPDAEIVPARISPSVIHICTSSMAQGLLYALAPGPVAPGSNKPGHDPANRCDVVSLSHGGLPSDAWAHAINQLYESGIVVVAASGDSYWAVIVDIATHFTVYPSAFNRVLTSVGATYLKQPYIIDKIGEMQGCWGPDIVMEKAVAAFTPNVVWMDYKNLSGFKMNGSGTSASTPQAAAACALWLQIYGNELPRDWSRVEACRLALFDGADDSNPDKSKLGWGLLNLPRTLDKDVAKRAISSAKAGKAAPKDSVSFAFWRLLLGIGPPNSAQDRMYETEVAQVVLQSTNTDLRRAANDANYSGKSLSPSDVQKFRMMLTNESISGALRRRIARV